MVLQLDLTHSNPLKTTPAQRYSFQTNPKRHVTNIVFSNGLLDPWSAFGVTTAPKGGDGSVVVVTIPDGGHHGAAGDGVGRADEEVACLWRRE